MAKIIDKFFPLTELEIQEFDLETDLSDNVTQTLARLLGYYEAGGKFLLVRLDNTGRMLVSSEQSKVDTGNVSQVSVSNTATLLLSANTNRRSYTIYNAGSIPLYIGFDNTVTPATGFPISSGSYFSDDIYVGNVYGIYSITGQPNTPLMEV